MVVTGEPEVEAVDGPGPLVVNRGTRATVDPDSDTGTEVRFCPSRSPVSVGPLAGTRG
jgi:hypothetical protein